MAASCAMPACRASSIGSLEWTLPGAPIMRGWRAITPHGDCQAPVNRVARARVPSHYRAMDSFLQDLRFALRGLRRAPAFTAIAALTIALGIGGSTAIFSVVNTVMLRPLPFGDGERLVRIQQTVARPDGTLGRVGVSQLNFTEVREGARSIESTVASRFRSLTVT